MAQKTMKQPKNSTFFMLSVGTISSTIYSRRKGISSSPMEPKNLTETPQAIFHLYGFI